MKTLEAIQVEFLEVLSNDEMNDIKGGYSIGGSSSLIEENDYP